MNYQRSVFASIAWLSTWALAGCATPGNGPHLGQSVNLMMAQQTMDPQAALNTNPVKGLDGKAAKSAYDAYQKSFKTPEPQSNSFTIGVGAR